MKLVDTVDKIAGNATVTSQSGRSVDRHDDPGDNALQPEAG